jgi:hypothetical protein
MKRKQDRTMHAATPEQIRVRQELRRGNASAKHDSRAKRQRTRAAVKAAAVREW